MQAAGTVLPDAIPGRTLNQQKAEKGAWRMPWLQEAMKDVISCEKRGGGANIP